MKFLSVCYMFGGLFSCFPTMAIEPDMLQKARFVARFVQLTEWPPPPPTNFRYFVAGNTPLLQALQQTKLYSSQGEPLQIEAVEQPAEAVTCQLLILSLDQHAELSRWQQQLMLTPVLLITDNSEAFHSLALQRGNAARFETKLTTIKARQRGRLKQTASNSVNLHQYQRDLRRCTSKNFSRAE